MIIQVTNKDMVVIAVKEKKGNPKVGELDIVMAVVKDKIMMKETDRDEVRKVFRQIMNK